MGTDTNTDLDYRPLQPTSTTNLYNQISWPALVKAAFAGSAVTPPRVSASAMDALAVYTIVTSAPKRNEPTEPTPPIWTSPGPQFHGLFWSPTFAYPSVREGYDTST